MIFSYVFLSGSKHHVVIFDYHIGSPYPNVFIELIRTVNKSKLSYFIRIVSEYDQEIPQSQIADNPMAP